MAIDADRGARRGSGRAGRTRTGLGITLTYRPTHPPRAGPSPQDVWLSASFGVGRRRPAQPSSNSV